MSPIQKMFLKAALAQLAKRAADDPFATADTGTEGQESDAGDRVGEDTDSAQAAAPTPSPFSWKSQGGSYRPPARPTVPAPAIPPKLAMLVRRGRARA